MECGAPCPRIRLGNTGSLSRSPFSFLSDLQECLGDLAPEVLYGGDEVVLLS